MREQLLAERKEAHQNLLVFEGTIACRGDDDFIFDGHEFGARHMLNHGVPLGACLCNPRRLRLLDSEHLRHERKRG